MTRLLVVDASAAVAIIRDEPAAPMIAKLLRDHVADGGRALVPSHFWLEVGNVLMRRYQFAPLRIIEELHDLDLFALESVDVDRSLLLLALDRMWAWNLTAYDGVYLALAESTDAFLVTLDARLAAAAGPRALPRPPHRLAEFGMAYEVGPAPDVWAHFGGYLAELRRTVAAD